MNALTTQQADANEIMESVIAKGDLAKLTPAERTSFYMQVCRSIGLNPLTKPFEYITLQGKMTLYARRDAADQLRKVNGISIQIVSKSVEDGILTVHVRATDKTGRTDEDYGVVNIGQQKGEAAANAFLKAVTKAKRRVTLSISGLGFLDETEVEDRQGAPVGVARRPPMPAPSQLLPTQQEVMDVETGEVTEAPPVDVSPWLDAGKRAASFGSDNLKQWWQSLEADQRKAIGNDALTEWKKDAALVDNAPAEEDVI